MIQEELRRRREQLETRLFILNEEIDDLHESALGCDDRAARERSKMVRIDDQLINLDQQVKEFMESIKRKKHALACERATHEEKCRVVAQDRARLDNKLVRSLTQATAGCCRSALRPT